MQFQLTSTVPVCAVRLSDIYFFVGTEHLTRCVAG